MTKRELKVIGFDQRQLDGWLATLASRLVFSSEVGGDTITIRVEGGIPPLGLPPEMLDPANGSYSSTPRPGVGGRISGPLGL